MILRRADGFPRADDGFFRLGLMVIEDLQRTILDGFLHLVHGFEVAAAQNNSIRARLADLINAAFEAGKKEQNQKRNRGGCQYKINLAGADPHV